MPDRLHRASPSNGSETAQDSHATLVDRVRRLTLVSNATAEMLLHDEASHVVARVFDLLRSDLKLDCCFNYLVTDDSTRLRLNFSAGVSPEQEASLEWLDFGQAVCGNVALQRAEIVREDVQTQDDPMVALIRSLGITAYVCEPLMAGDRLVGTLSVGTRARPRFLRDEIELLRSLAVPLAHALDRRRLIANLRQIRERADILQALATDVSAAETPARVAEAVIEHTTAMFEAVGTVVTRVLEDGATMEILDARAMQHDHRTAWTRFPLHADAPLAEVARTGQSLTVDSPEEWSRRYPALAGMMEEEGHHSLLVVPLCIESRAIGAVGIAFDRPRKFTADDHRLALIVAQHTSQAMERARLLEAERVARHAAESADREKAQLLASVSHDLRTPLNAVGGYVELMEMELHGPLTEQQRQDLARIRSNQRHLLHLVEDLLRFSALTSESRPREIRRIAATDALESAMMAVMPQAESKRISLELRAEDVALHGDPERVSQILINLLANAVKFTPVGGVVTLSAEPADGEAVCLRVRDTGPGIPTDMHAAIFEPFRQLASRKRDADGVGLGLAISRTLARASGGDVAVESEPGQGSTFIVRLPRAT